MPIVHLTARTFEDVTEKGTVFIDWWAGWCGPCRVFAPVFEAAAARHPDIVFAKIDTDAEPGLATANGIRSIPTLMIFRDGLLLFVEPGAMPAGTLDELAAAVKALDMADVRRRISHEVRAGEDANPARPGGST